MRRLPLALAILTVGLALGCPGAQNVVNAPAPPPPRAARAKEPLDLRLSKTGLGFRLSDTDDDAAGDGAAPAVTTPLDAEDTKKLFARLPPLKADPELAQPFALRAKSLPAPRPGETIKEHFPPEAPSVGAPQVHAGPLHVTRHEPDGPVKLAPYLTVSFDAPMVALTSHDDLSKLPVPVTLSPEPPGKWRWVGTQTVMFQPDRAFPMATAYAVDIKAGTKSATGAVLATGEHFAFSTPPLAMQEHGPAGGAVKLDPVIFARFDQAIDRDLVLAKTVVKADGKPIAVRLATQAEMDADDVVRRLAEERGDSGPLSLGVGDYHSSAGGQYTGAAHAVTRSRLLAFVPAAPLHTSSLVEVVFPAGTPSAEGPKTTTSDQRFDFRTYGPLRVIDHRCEHCNPFSAFSVMFTNEIDLAKFDKSIVTVTPPIPDMKVVTGSSWLNITGRKKGRTRYTVKIGKSLTDIFGQTLDDDDTHTFDVGPAGSVLFGEERPMIVQDPKAGPALEVFSVNEPTLHVRLFEVTPSDYDAYVAWRQKWDYDGVQKTPPGKLVADRVVHPVKTPDELVSTRVDLGPALKGGFGQVLAIVETPRPFKNRWQKEWVRTWLQVTHLGLAAVADAADLAAWTTSLADGAPLAGVDVSCAASAAKSEADGVAHLRATAGQSIVARKGNDSTFLPGGLYVYSQRPSATRFFTFDDRKMYKPGEDVHVKGWVRSLGAGKGGDVSLVPGAEGQPVHWVANDPRGAELSRGDATVSALGGFDFVVKTPANANLGAAMVSLQLGSQTERGVHTFEIQEFRRPEFEVHATTSEGPHVVGEHAVASVDAKYYAGGGLPDAEVSWTVTRSLASFQPPNQGAYVFGKAEYSWQPWHPGSKPERTTDTWKGHTDAQGTHRMRIDLEALEPAYPMSLSISASVTDVNRQAWAAGTSLLVHPAGVYVGLKPEKSFLAAGQAIQLGTIVVDVDGKPVPGRAVSVSAVRLDWEQTRSGFEEREVDEQTCAVTSGDAAAFCTFPTKKGGSYRIKAVVVDEAGRKSQTITRLWVMDRDTPPDRGLGQDKVQLLLDKKAYAGGDTAELLVLSPFAPAEGMLVVARQGILSTSRFTMAAGMQTLKVKLDASMTPSVEAFVLLAGKRPRENEAGLPDAALAPQPAFASGEVHVAIPPDARKLEVAVTPRDKAVEPSGHTTVDVDVKDARGAAVAGAEVAVVVVDESILALSGYQLPDPLDAFYPVRDAGVSRGGTRELVVLARPDTTRLAGGGDLLFDSDGAVVNGLDQLRFAEGGGGGMSFGKNARAVTLATPMPPPPPGAPAPTASAAPKPKEDGKPTTAIAVRTDFAALAVWKALERTDDRGHVEVPVKLPDSVTRYRVMAVAVAHDNEFGSKESSITARLPLMVRPSAPRFLNYGDKFELPIVLQNQTSLPIHAEVAVRSINASITESPGKRVDIPANDRVLVRFLAAAEKPGKARFQIGAAAGAFADASQVELPVWTPATTEAFATYGVIDDGAIAQPVKMPGGVVTQFGGLEVTTSSTAMQGLTDAVVYLVHYPFECNEQLASRILAIASLRDVLTAFDSRDLPPPADLNASVLTDLEKLRTRQKWDGGFAFWWGEEWPFISIHVSHTLARAEAKGYKVDATMRQRSVGWLRSVESHIPAWYDAESRRAIVAYALYVRRLLKDADPARARRLIDEYGGVEKMNLEAVGWIWPTISQDPGSAAANAKIRRFVANRVSETAGAAHFVTSYGDGDYLLLHSDRRADGVLLEAMMIDEPDTDLIPKLVKGLLAHRKAGRWGSTQENAFVLLALDQYFEKYEKATPDFVARVWLGADYAGEHTFKGRTTEYGEIDVPMELLAHTLGQKEENLTLGKEGPGRLYFRVGMQYAPEDLRPQPMDQGFTVSRTYEAAEDPDGASAAEPQRGQHPSDVRRDADGTWHFKAGTKVRVRVTMIVPSRRYHVALVDPIPAGVEPMNPALAVTGVIPQDPAAQKSADPYWYWHSTWYEHQNMRDERVEAFASLVWEGLHEYVYTVRATTPGTFVVPPPKAEEMYSPEVFGRGAADRVVIE